MNRLHPLLAIVGPTAVGKSQLAIQLALRFEGEIVSADSRQLYRGMDIGTAKPSAEQRALVPHHLIDVVRPDETWSLSSYRAAALTTIQDVQHRGRLPILVGGTGQYVMAILEGWEPPPRGADDSLRRELEQYAETHGKETLHRRLAEIDPLLAGAIDARNTRRVIRALEVYHLTGQPPSHIRRRTQVPFQDLRIGLNLPRRDLYARIDARIDDMLNAGWVEEVRELLQQGYGPELPAMSAIGYRQLTAYLQGIATLEDALKSIRRASRQFVRRQANWFKAGDSRIHWFEAMAGVELRAAQWVREWLAGRSEDGDAIRRGRTRG